MESEIIERELTDESLVYEVHFIDGSSRMILSCLDEKSAEAVQKALETHVCYAVMNAQWRTENV